MSAELDTRFQVVSPTTGEVLSPDSPTEDLGAVLADLRELEGRLREGKDAVQSELLARFDRAASWTHRVPGYKLTAPSPAPKEEFDALPLRSELLALVDAGVLSIEAVDAAIETTVTYKARARGISALRKLGGQVESTIDAHTSVVEKRRYVSVTPA